MFGDSDLYRESGKCLFIVIEVERHFKDNKRDRYDNVTWKLTKRGGIASLDTWIKTLKVRSQLFGLLHAIASKCWVTGYPSWRWDICGISKRYMSQF